MSKSINARRQINLNLLKRKCIAFWTILGVTIFTSFSVNAQLTESSSQKAKRMEWWKNARFGMFIHWGSYSEAAGYWNGKPVKGSAEWIMSDGHIPRKQYEKLAKGFNPHHFNADYWARVAKNAGVKYIVVTSKHHEGFAMFPTKTTDYNIVDATPWDKDPLEALSKACKKYGIEFCIYYSIMDWHSPYQLPRDNSDPQHPTYSPTKIRPGKKEAYIKYMKAQLHEIVSRYNPALIWFDGEWLDWWKSEDGKDLYSYLRKLNPNLITNNRLGNRRSGKEDIGDYGTPEQKIPANGIPGSYWETCMTINGNWGYDKSDFNFKSDTMLIRNLIDIASKGGNYLLNVGPTADGIIPLPEIERLTAIGHWLEIYGSAIYGSEASPFKEKFDWGRVTRKKNKLFLEIFHWPEDGVLNIPDFNGKITSCYLIGDPDRTGVTARKAGDKIAISLPGKAPNLIASVVEIDFD